jgi:uncharacterized protein GlcG (DUF336 family)
MRASPTHDQACRIPGAGIAEAEEIGRPMNTAVVDDGGHLAAFGRVDGAIEASIDPRSGQVHPHGRPHRGPHPLVRPGAELHGLEQTAGGLVASGGGLPLYRDGGIAGAVGVSAGAVEQDVVVATAAAAALAGRARPPPASLAGRTGMGDDPGGPAPPAQRGCSGVT